MLFTLKDARGRSGAHEAGEKEVFDYWINIPTLLISPAVTLGIELWENS